MVAIFLNSEQKLTTFVNFFKFPEISLENSVIPGGPGHGNSQRGSTLILLSGNCT